MEAEAGEKLEKRGNSPRPQVARCRHTGNGETLSGPVTTHPDALSSGMPQQEEGPVGEAGMGKGHLPSFQGHPEGMKGI